MTALPDSKATPATLVVADMSSRDREPNHTPRRRPPARVAAWLLVFVAVFAACGSEEVPVTPTPSPAPTDSQPAATAALEPVVSERVDGLTGAPVPPPSASSAVFDGSLLNERAGSFPPLDDPAVVPAAEAEWMGADDLVLGAVQNGESRAYPLFMLTLHHVANDTLGGEPYLVTF